MRRLAWAVILFQLLWLNVFVPGHTRGAVTVAGSDQTTADCCAATKHTSHDAPTPDQQRRCAVCYVVAGYTLPPVFDIDLRPSGLIAIQPNHQVEDAPSLAILLAYHANAPPAGCCNLV
jgi:hypothetical protein